ncbi:HmuY family protein [Pedobacter sp. NJ-S-72]
MNKFTQLITLLCFATAFTACKKDSDPIIATPASTGSKITLNGLIGTEPGSSAGNSVFVDFSADKQTSVARASWDLGFYSGPDFKVILNNTVGATAIALNETDLSKVTEADTVALANAGTLSLGQGAGGFNYIDPIVGDLSTYLAGTVIKTISAADADNKVYIVNRGGTTGWQKIRVIRTGTGYTLQYGKISDKTFKSLNVAKDGAFNFKHVSFTNGAVDVEPAKANWDIEWTLATYKANETIPYTFSDFVLINFVGGVTAAEVLVADSKVSFADFAEANLSTVKFVGKREVIAGNWRSTVDKPVGVKTDRFYLVKDGAGNIYKLNFVNFHASDGGVRGKPVIEYKLVKKA